MGWRVLSPNSLMNTEGERKKVNQVHERVRSSKFRRQRMAAQLTRTLLTPPQGECVCVCVLMLKKKIVIRNGFFYLSHRESK